MNTVNPVPGWERRTLHWEAFRSKLTVKRFDQLPNEIGRDITEEHRWDDARFITGK